MERGCFLLHVKAGRLDDYLAAHETVWPELLDEIRRAGVRNYSMFFRPDGMLVAYLEGDDLRGALASVGTSAVSARWQEYMAEYFDGAIEPLWLEEYFHTD